MAAGGSVPHRFLLMVVGTGVSAPRGAGILFHASSGEVGGLWVPCSSQTDSSTVAQLVLLGCDATGSMGYPDLLMCSRSSLKHVLRVFTNHRGCFVWVISDLCSRVLVSPLVLQQLFDLTDRWAGPPL